MSRLLLTFSISAALAVSYPVFAAGPDDGHHHGHHKGHEMGKGHMKQEMKKHQSGDMSEHTREVMGEGRINKIMADRGMVNIKHEPMPEMNWPKMRMNFRVDEGVDLNALKPGQMVDFTLLVDSDNNYVIKNINGK